VFQVSKFYVGQSASFSKTITESDVVQYAGLSGDFNPVHVNKEYAKNSRFGQRIAHGLLTTSLLSGLLGNYLPGHGVIYLEQTLKFLHPVFIGDTVKARGEVIDFNPQNRIIRLKTECYNQENILVLDGEATMMVPKEEEVI
jgi:3-hydroxybutyryl-CoA dehydratase